MAKRAIAAAALLAGAAAAHPQAPATHRLKATPATVACGWYDAAAPPVLRIRSGDIIDVDTILTNTPAGLQRAGMPDHRIQASLVDGRVGVPVKMPKEIFQ